jgi:hypothetical protein
MYSFIDLVILSNLFTNNTITGSTDVSLFKNNAVEEMSNLLFKVNEANRKINHYCDIVETDQGILTAEQKPSCNLNFSYVDSNYTIYMYKYDENMRTFLETKRTKYCKDENMLCGELTIIIKIFNLINGVTNIMMETTHTYDSFMFNLKITDFKNLYYLYVSSLENTDILINITLKRQHANVILEKERTRLNKRMNQAYYERFADNVNLYVGEPLFGGVKYLGSSVGNIVGETISGIVPDMAFESKIIILVILLIILKKV